MAALVMQDRHRPGSEPAQASRSALLHTTARRIALHLDSRLRDEGFRLEQWHILDELARSSAVSMRELADATLIPSPSLTRLVDGLVSAALVYRIDDPADRRRVLVRISDDGTAAHRRLAAVVAAAERETFGGLGASEAEALEALLQQLTTSAGVAQPR